MVNLAVGTLFTTTSVWMDSSDTPLPSLLHTDAKEHVSSPPRKRRKTRRETRQVKLPPPAVVPHLAVPDSHLTPAERQAKFRGRNRQVPHQPGIWASQIFIPVRLRYSQPLELEAIRTLCDCARRTAFAIQKFGFALRSDNLPLPLSEEFHEPTTDQMDDVIEFHVSLSKLCLLRKDQIPAFTDRCRLLADRLPYPLEFREASLLPSEDKGTIFLVAKAVVDGAGYIDFQRMLEDTDQVMDHFRLSRYYSEAIPHMSVGWISTPSPTGTDLPFAEVEEEITLSDYFEVSVSSVACRVGKKTYTFPFSSRPS